MSTDYSQNFSTITCGLNKIQTSTVKIVALLLKADDNDDIRAAIMTAIIKPTKPTGSIFNTSLGREEKWTTKTVKIEQHCVFPRNDIAMVQRTHCSM